jgi:hypothetical protein
MFDKSIIDKIVEKSPLTLVLAGVLLFIIGAAGALPIGDPPLQIADINWRIALAIFGVILFGAGIIFLWQENIYDNNKNTNEKERHEKLEPVNSNDYTSMSEATSLLCNIAKKEQEKLSINIIASTGGSTVSTLLPSIVNATNAYRIEISIFLINKSSPIASYYPGHWANETDVILEKIRTEWADYEQKNIQSFDVYLYDFLPILHGIMLNDEHLLFGFYSWKHFSGKIQLSGAESQHRYYSMEKQPASHFLFDVFHDWIEHMPCEKIISLR